MPGMNISLKFNKKIATRIGYSKDISGMADVLFHQDTGLVCMKGGRQLSN